MNGNSFGCEHLAAWKQAQNKDAVSSRFGPLQRSLVTQWRRQAQTAELCGPKACCLRCARTTSGSQIDLSGPCYAADGVQGQHAFIVDIERRELFCSGCGDYVHDRSLDQAIAAAAALLVPERPNRLRADANSTKLATPMLSDLGKDYHAANGIAMDKRCTALPCDPASAPGLRGLTNLGNTCFMASILQAFLHTPPFRDYFLSGQHMNRRTKGNSCITCELDAVFTAAYSGERRPLKPTAFLLAWWQQADHHLASYGQQDAHEFYLNVLSGLDEAAQCSSPASSGVSLAEPSGPPGLPAVPNGWGHTANGWHGQEDSAARLSSQHSSSLANGHDDAGRHSQSTSPPAAAAPGIVQQSFGGTLQSDVICTSCGYVSTTCDPFLDISLDIDPPRKLPAPLAKRTPPPSSNKNGKRVAGAAAAAKNAKAAKRAAAAMLASADSALSEDLGLGFVERASTVTPSPRGSPTPTSTLDISITTDGNAPTAVTNNTAAASSAGASVEQTATSPRRHLPTEFAFRHSQDEASSPVLIIQEPSQSMQSDQWTPATHRARPIISRSPSQSSLPSGSELPSSRPQPTPVQMQPPPTQTAGTPQSHMRPPQQGCLSRPISAPAAVASSPSKAKTIAPSLAGKNGIRSPPAVTVPGKKPRPVRCGQCYTCRTPSLKKGCQRNHQLRTQGQDPALMTFEELQAVPIPLDDGSGFRPSAAAVPVHLGETLAPLSSPRSPVQPSHIPAQRAATAPKEIPRLNDLLLPANKLPLPHKGAMLSEQTLGAATMPGVSCAIVGEEAIKVPLVPSVPPGQQLATYKPIGAASLLGCLHRFVRPESLGDAADWKCDGCKECQRATKQMSIRRLPRVLCLHVKRFEHGFKAQGRKVDTPLLYPAFLNMRPFLASSVLQRRHSMHPAWHQQQPGRTSAADGTTYELYAIVVHRGHLQGGHYIASIKCGQQWFQCDDAVVTAVDAAVAHSPHAYMLFYRLACPSA
ncbi:hypothetical protein WJX73_004987 [Symbiochloris irregularis]|uniref:Ubiquitin carboxyl-terminal hydrolase n=1 Tax=Symbiochloris irregularis TaxID=706552 RepID=A0AAW1PLK7_9CHLO